jgi:hypothetical protein
VKVLLRILLPFSSNNLEVFLRLILVGEILMESSEKTRIPFALQKVTIVVRKQKAAIRTWSTIFASVFSNYPVNVENQTF